jgi:hypothetical protein
VVRDCGHQLEPDPVEQSERYSAEMTLPDWRERLVCSKCGGREIDMVVSGTERRREQIEAPTPPLVNRSAGVVTPITPSAVIVAR